MAEHLNREIEKLKKLILSLSATVEESVYKAVNALEERSIALAEEVIRGDTKIDQMEVDVEEECLKVLALYQPVAIDLRFIIAILKIDNDLERVGDLAVNIAERVCFLATREKHEIQLDFQEMAEKTQDMFRKSLDSLVNRDVGLAHEVLGADDEIDAINREMYVQIQDAIRKKPEQLESLIHLLSCSRHLERIADLATNVAEDVIYMIEGEIVRHGVEDYCSESSDDN
ncbi:MAG: phosphate signaling complex protein PhoU [Candidatus Krumholzibacteria bacterium]|nr:phosphate signaling complex protein PhoU [Candidatus Krumholzibacteria bacterium]